MHQLLTILPALVLAAAQGDIPADTEIITTASGLKYSVLKAGAGGASPKPTEKFTAHYTGWLTDGTEFDSSRKGPEPGSFRVGQVIQGWNEAVQLMTKGARFKLTIPPELAYGAKGFPPVIPPNATLIFDIELIDFTPRPAFPPAELSQQKTAPSGLKWEVLSEGDGPLAANDDMCTVEFAYWKASGEPLGFSGDVQPLQCTPQNGPPFLQEALPMMRKGSRLRLEVPFAMAFAGRKPDNLQAGDTTVWEITLIGMKKTEPVPTFSLSPADKLTTTASGLQYEVLRPGTGKQPNRTSRVTVHYAGWLTDGTPFDSSYSRGQPATFGVTQVISGWTEGLQLMQEGAAYKFTIPSALAYGSQGSPPKIKPNATLVFQVELLKVTP